MKKSTLYNKVFTFQACSRVIPAHTVSPGGKRRSRAGLRWSGSNGVVKTERSVK